MACKQCLRPYTATNPNKPYWLNNRISESPRLRGELTMFTFRSTGVPSQKQTTNTTPSDTNKKQIHHKSVQKRPPFGYPFRSVLNMFKTHNIPKRFEQNQRQGSPPGLSDWIQGPEPGTLERYGHGPRPGQNC
jgi:hypothetical protein